MRRGAIFSGLGRAVLGIAGVCGLAVSLLGGAVTQAWADPAAIGGIVASGASEAGHGPELAIDGDPGTYWQSPGSSSTKDYRRFLDFDLGGLYSVTSLSVQNVEGSSYRYEVYLSKDGKTFDKVAFKVGGEAATGEADAYELEQPVEARYARVNVSWNSSSQAVNLAEVSFTGALVSDEPFEKDPIEIVPFEGSEWGKEWEKFESDAAYAEQKTVDEVYALIGRVVGEEYKGWFDLSLRDAKDGKDVFEISDGSDGRIVIRGNDGVSLASGVNYYLRHWCKVDYNPIFGSNLAMPKSAPKVGKKQLKYTNYEYRYALNFCTYSYTMSFWNWDEYEEFLDWAAMNGVNLMLDIVGQEEVLRETLTQYGYTDDEVKDYISGPAYFAWFYMQNMFSWGGPLPDSWFEQRVELGRKIHDRMQAFGITPVMQGFAGQVPEDFQEKNPDSIAASSGTWCGYHRPYMIKPYLTDEDKAQGKVDYFDEVGERFYDAQQNLFGDITNYYAVDPYHEGGTVPSGFNIVDIYRTVQQRMIESDKDAIWVMQQWSGGINETKLSGLANKDQALVLDLQSNLNSQKGPMENQHVPWIWNMLFNFGGRMGMDGTPETLATQPPQAYNDSEYMCGIGITPEAIANSPIVFELMLDMTWEQDPIDYRAWTRDYVERRYGGTDEKIQEAWEILLDTAYRTTGKEFSQGQGAPESLINARPSDGKIGASSSWGYSLIDYDKEEFERAARLFIECYDTYKDSEAFRYDFADVMRQVLQNSFQEYQSLAGQAYLNGDLEAYKTLSGQMLDIIKAQDEMLSTSDYFLMGSWIEDARTMLEDEDDWTKDLFELNARALVTTWGLQKNGSLNDYSNRQWAGLTGDYYYSRWERHISERLSALEGGAAPSSPDWFMVGWEWANRKSDEGFGLSAAASDIDQKALAEKIMDAYSVSVMDEYTGGATTDERVNLALGRDVTDVAAQKTVPNLTDGNAEIGWEDPGKPGVTLEIDLGGTYVIKGASLAFQQIPVDYHVRYAIEVLDSSGEWVEAGKSGDGVLSSNNEISCNLVGSKVRYTLEATDGGNLPGIYELGVYGTAQPESSYKNLSLGATATAKSTETGRQLSGAIDGDESTLWVNAGAGESWYQVDLAAARRVDRVRLVFEQPGRLFQFRVVAGMEDGSTEVILDKTDNQAGLAGDYAVDLGKDVKYVKVEFTGSVGGEAWPAIAELELLQEQEVALSGVNVAPQAEVTSSPTEPDPKGTASLTDGDLDSIWVSQGGSYPAWFELAWPEVQHLEHITLHFENGVTDRSMQFQVKVCDAEGNEALVFERGEDLLNTDQGQSIDIPLSDDVKDVQRIRVEYINGRVPSTGAKAWPLLAEIQAFATPDNVALDAALSAGEGSALSEQDLAKLHDGAFDEAVSLSGAADKELTFAFEKPVDIDGIGIGTGLSGEPVRFIAEYRTVPEEGAGAEGEWKPFADWSGNTRVKPDVLARADTPVFADAVRVTFLSEGAVPVNELMLYQADVTSMLSQAVNAALASLDGLTFGECAGNYSEAARDELMAVLDEAKAAVATNPNSREVASWTAKVDAAVSAFWREGFVSLDRNDLYVAVDDAEALLAALKEQGAGDAIISKLDAALEEARAVADAYGTVTQADVDAAAEALAGACDEALAALDAKDRFEVVLAAAKQLLSESEVGEFEGQYSQVVADGFSAAIEAAEGAFDAAAGDAAKIDQATEALQVAKDAFLKAVVHIDASALDAVIAQAEALDSSRYDRDAWAKVAEALDAAKAVDVKAISQADLDDIAKRLSAAVDALSDAILDRSALEAAIAAAQGKQEGDYTPESWKPFADAYQAALEALKAPSTTQAELDKAAKLLSEKCQGLVFKTHGGGDDGQGGGQGDQGGQGGQQGGGSGTGTPSGGTGAGSDAGSGQGGTGSASADRLVGTGDGSSAVIAGCAAAGAGVVIVGVMMHRRRGNGA